MLRKGFVSTMRRGFHMTFKNGLTISVQWGAGNYCDNHFPEDLDFSYSKDAKSDTAEIAVITPNGEFIDPQTFVKYDLQSDGAVAGWLDADQVAELIHNVSMWET